MSKDCPYNVPFKSEYTLTLSSEGEEILQAKDQDLNKLLSFQEQFKSLTDSSFSTKIVGSDIFLYEGSEVK